MRVGDAIHRCHVWQAVFRRSRSHCAPEGARESGQPRWPPPLGGAGAGGGSRVAWGAVGAGGGGPGGLPLGGMRLLFPQSAPVYFPRAVPRPPLLPEAVGCGGEWEGEGRAPSLSDVEGPLLLLLLLLRQRRPAPGRQRPEV